MRSLRGIPRRLMRQTMGVMAPNPSGGFYSPVTVPHVRWQRVDSVEPDDAEGAPAGTIYVGGDPLPGDRGFAPGATILIEGECLRLSKASCRRDVSGRVHHWELEVKRDEAGWL